MQLTRKEVAVQGGGAVPLTVDQRYQLLLTAHADYL
jgi:hypothetical protein